MREKLRAGMIIGSCTAGLLLITSTLSPMLEAARFQPAPPPIDSEFDPPPVPPVERENIDDLRRRLEQLEQRLQQRPEGRRPQLDSLEPLPLEAESACQTIDIQTKPNHKFRGRMFLDHLMVEDSPNQTYENFTGFDTIRLGVYGSIYENLKYMAEFEFEGEEVDYKSIYAEFSELPWVSTLRLGYFRQPMGLEELTSSRFNTFMERSLATTAFVPRRKFGIRIGGDIRDNRDLSGWVSLYRDQSNDDPNNRGGFRSDHNDTGVAGRLVYLPFYDEPSDGRYLLHTGASFTHTKHFTATGSGDPSNATGNFNGSLELDSYSSVIAASLANRAAYSTIGTELAWVNGPFSIQNEFFWVNSSDGSNPWGGYAEVSYFLTGESRGYNRSSKVFTRVQPFEPFFAVRTANGVCRGWGAWQLAARWSYLDASDPALQGTLGIQQNFTLGVNWYLNAYSRVMLNYVHADADVNAGQTLGAPPVALVDAEVNNVGLRFQIDW